MNGNGGPPPPRITRLPCTLVVRESVAPLNSPAVGGTRQLQKVPASTSKADGSPLA